MNKVTDWSEMNEIIDWSEAYAEAIKILPKGKRLSSINELRVSFARALLNYVEKKVSKTVFDKVKKNYDSELEKIQAKSKHYSRLIDEYTEKIKRVASVIDAVRAYEDWRNGNGLVEDNKRLWDNLVTAISTLVAAEGLK